LTLLVGRQEGHPACKKLEWWGAGVAICLELGADLHMAQLMPLPLTVSCFSESTLVLLLWYWLTWVVAEKGSLNVCSSHVALSYHIHRICHAVLLNVLNTIAACELLKKEQI